MSDKGHPIRNGIIATVVGGIILAAILNPWFRTTILSILSFIKKTFAVLFAWASLHTKIANWLLLALCVLAGITVLRWIAIILHRHKQPQDSYDHDSIFGVDWRWSGGGKNVYGLWCFCPRCDVQLVYHEQRKDHHQVCLLHQPHFTEFVCENCGIRSKKLAGDHQDGLARVERESNRRFRTGEWKKTNSQQ